MSVRKRAAGPPGPKGHSRLFVLLTSIVLAAACSSPAERFNADAVRHGYDQRSVTVRPHTLTVHLATDSTAGGVWHVYLEGDGTPWRHGRHRSTDPTPETRMALELMDRDHGPRLLLHRPCYARPAMEAACDPALWTESRYGDQVVRTMDRALDALVAEYSIDGLVLIGYSGGGTLARLLAGRRDDVRGLVTLAANLDHAAWTAHHGYLPLTGSLRVPDSAPLGPHVLQLHLAGSDDGVVPVWIVRQGAAHDPHADIETVDGFDHRCCWADLWPAVLKRLQPLH
ncbi:MAG: alpha/beta hydrolase [Ectothiorhodospiraceae bacterium]|nr:alpha/beta hydrolase [Ectothiorhodospiraceae bacterium]